MGKKSKRQRAEAEKTVSTAHAADTRPIYTSRAIDQKSEKLWAILAIGVVFLTLVLYFAAQESWFFMVLPFAAFSAGVVSILRRERPTEKMTASAVLLLAFVLLCGLASLYSDFRDFSSVAFGKWLSIFCVFLIVVLVCKKERVHTLILGTSAGIALTALFSIDSASLHKLTDFFIGLLLRIDTSKFSYWGDGRISGLFTNPNISGSMFALGIFLSLYGVRSARGQKVRMVMYGSLALSSLAFLLSFSMGAIGFFVLGVAAYLSAVGKEERAGLFVLMAESAVSTMVCGTISTLGLGKVGIVTLVPNLVALANCVLIHQLDNRVGVKLAEKLKANGKAASLALAAAGGAALLYVVLGFNLTGAMELEAGSWVRRSAYPAAGEYTLQVDGPTDLLVRVYGQDSQQTAMHNSTLLYEGAEGNAQFTVPEGTKVVHFDFSSPEGGKLSSVTYEGVAQGKLKLHYLILPEFVATRIQGLWANQNVIQRLTFYGDALKIWKLSPFVGKGMGAFEAYRPQVAEFSYNTRYAHNVYVQTMAETGLLGIILLLGVIAAFAALLLKGRHHKVYGPLAAPLLACLTMMWGHGSFEVIWSSQPYMLVAGLVLAAAQILFGEHVTAGVAERRAIRLGAAILCGACLLIFGGLFAVRPINMITLERASRMTYEDFMGAAAEGVDKSPYDSDFYRATYLNNAFAQGDEGVFPLADQYAARLAEGNTYSYGTIAAEYYFIRGEEERAFDALRQAALRGRADPATWDSVIETAMAHYEEDRVSMEEGVKSLYQLWRQVAEYQLDGAVFSEIQMSFLTKIGEK